jgi:hypothetical protein
MAKNTLVKRKSLAKKSEHHDQHSTDLKAVIGQEVNGESYSDGVTVTKYYIISDLGEVIINHNTAKADRTQDGRVILVPKCCEDYFNEDELGTKSLNKDLAGYEITVGGEVVVVPNKPLMRNFQLFA